VATARTAVRLVALLMTTAVLMSGLPSGAVHADPSRATEQAAAELERLNTVVDSAVEDFHDAEIAVAKAQRADAAARLALTQAQQRVSELQAGLADVAAAAYRSGGASPVLALIVSGSAEGFVEGASSLEHVARSKADRLAEFAVARRDLERQAAASARELTKLRALESRLAAKRAEIEAAVERQTALLKKLRAADKRREAAERAAAARAAAARAAEERARRAAAEAARVAASRATRSRTTDRADSDDGDDDSDGTSEPTAPVPSSGRGAIAVRFAYAQLGKPYRWAADGPGSYDCSGLTMAAWAAAGVSLSHSSRMQINEGRRVSWSQLQPGDLVFYGSPIHHVGIYIGGGRKIAAPQTGDVVKIASASRPDYVGATRPG
jgi:cell wall-associated NlpC family hydrolase